MLDKVKGVRVLGNLVFLRLKDQYGVKELVERFKNEGLQLEEFKVKIQFYDGSEG